MIIDKQMNFRSLPGWVKNLPRGRGSTLFCDPRGRHRKTHMRDIYCELKIKNKSAVRLRQIYRKRNRRRSFKHEERIESEKKICLF